MGLVVSYGHPIHILDEVGIVEMTLLPTYVISRISGGIENQDLRIYESVGSLSENRPPLAFSMKSCSDQPSYSIQ